MSLESMITLALAMFILAASPGPGIFAATAQALSGGFRSSLNVIASIVTGDLLFLVLAVFGLSAVAATMGELFFLVRLAGGGYLVWLGIRMWTRKPESATGTISVNHRGPWKRYLGGLFITLGNPKVILFYAGFLPNFLDLGRLQSVDFLVAAFIVSGVLFVVMVFYCLGAARMRRLFSSPRSLCNLNRGAGTIMIGAGVAVAARS